jgi:hypothetical protein
MTCVKCGMSKRGAAASFICDDCQEFSQVERAVFDEAHAQIERSRTIDPDTNPLLRLLADTAFITMKNPQTAIYYKVSDYIVERAFAGDGEISEDDLNHHVSTTRGWGDAFKVFEELDLVRVRTEKFRRVLVLTDKTRKFARQYRTGVNISSISIQKRLAQLYATYVLLFILKKVADLKEDSDASASIPYDRIPRTLWVILMFLWLQAYNRKLGFSEEDLRTFVSKRRIPSTTRGKILGALQGMDGRVVQGLIKTVGMKGGERSYAFDDYVVNEMLRLREQVRGRGR